MARAFSPSNDGFIEAHVSMAKTWLIIAATAFSVSGLATFVAVAPSYLGVTVPTAPSPPPPLEFLDSGQTITLGGKSIDLTRPVFAAGRVCLRDSLDATFPSEAPDLCPAADTRMPITVDRVATNEIGEPVLFVELDAQAGIVTGWASFHDLRN